MKKVIFVILRTVLLVLGVGATINGIVLFFTTNLNIGNILTLVFGIMSLFIGIFFKKVNKIFPNWIKALFIAGISVVVLFCSFLLIFGTSDNVTYKEDAIIVLGAGVHGDVPSLTLKDRLDTAVEYYNQNPDVLIVVSGGKGPQEDVTEAFAMEKYLLEKGVKAKNILKEEKSTSTHENFKFSKELLDGHLGNGYSAAFITNEYHVFRAGGISKTAGIENCTHIHSNTRWYSLLPGTLRECLAVVKFWLLSK